MRELERAPGASDAGAPSGTQERRLEHEGVWMRCVHGTD